MMSGRTHDATRGLQQLLFCMPIIAWIHARCWHTDSTTNLEKYTSKRQDARDASCHASDGLRAIVPFIVLPWTKGKGHTEILLMRS